MSFASRLRERREALGLNQAELGKKLGVTGSAIGNYENGVSTPKADILFQVFDALKCDANYLFQDEMRELATTYPAYSVQEAEYIKKYRALDEHGTRAVEAILDIEYERCTAASNAAGGTRLITLASLPASAGTGEPLDSYGSEKISIPDTPENKYADFAVRVSGDSMEPMFRDGDLVLVHEQDSINEGDVGIFSVNGEGFIKKLGRGELISLNTNYQNIRLRDVDTVRCSGKVIGVLR